jgi:hypothetical protein
VGWRCGRGGADERRRSAPPCVRRLRQLAAGAVIATRPAGRYSGPPAEHKASRKEQTIGAGGCSKARLGRAFG